MNDLTKFLKFLFAEEIGYVYVATKKNLSNGDIDWTQSFFNWPTERTIAENYIATQSVELDVYVAPALFKTKSGLRSQVKGSNVVWIEFDGQEEIDFDSSDIPTPDLIIQTSDEFHRHCYWKLEKFSEPDAVEDINRRLTYHLEADNTGWDANQVLRPPDSFNWKHGGAPVSLVQFIEESNGFDPSSFDAAPTIEQPVIHIQEVQLLDPEELLQSLPLNPKLAKRIRSEVVSGPQDGKEGARSSFLMKIGYELAEEGCNHVQIVSLLSYVDGRIGKFKNRRDKLTRLSEIAARALLGIEQDSTPVLYSPFEILQYSEDLDWILEGWLHRSGFMIVTGAPGVGKTTFCLQLVHHLATAKDFLGKELGSEFKVLFLSLEMGIVELTYFFNIHKNEFDNQEKWDVNLRVLAEEFTLMDYEEIFMDIEPQVVLVDSLTELTRAEMKEDEARAVTRWIKKCRRRYNTSFICIHHNRKDEKSRKRPLRWSTTLSDVYGSFIFQKDVDTVINLESYLEEDENIVDCYSLKTRYGRPFKLELKRNDNLIFDLQKAAKQNDNQDIGTTRSGKIDLKF